MESTTIDVFHEINHNDINAMTTIEKTTSIGVYMGCFDALAAMESATRSDSCTSGSSGLGSRASG